MAWWTGLSHTGCLLHTPGVADLVMCLVEIYREAGRHIDGSDVIRGRCCVGGGIWKEECC